MSATVFFLIAGLGAAVACWPMVQTRLSRWRQHGFSATLPCPYRDKRHFRVRQDGWVRHDGGACPLPAKCRVAIWHRGVPASLEDLADRIPEQWWRQEGGKYDVLWFRPLEHWQDAPPPIERRAGWQ